MNTAPINSARSASVDAMNSRREVVGSASRAPAATAALLAAASEALAATSASPELDAALLLSFAAGRPRSSLLAFPERTVAPEQAARFATLIARRAAGEPLAYLTGEREFYSLPLEVTPAVLVPRPETELLVDTALGCAALRSAAPSVVDLGTGSGAIALAIKKERPQAVVTAVDASAAALAIARSNGVRLGLEVRWLTSDWFAALGNERFDVVVANPPYVRAVDVSGDLGFEPRLALDGGTDGLDAYRAILSAAPLHLAAHGAVVFEHGAGQRQPLAALAATCGFTVEAAYDDLAGLDRVLVLTLSGQR